MPSGGDRRPLALPTSRDLEYASQLLCAMREEMSPEASLFNAERHSLYCRWRRLIYVLSRYRVFGLGEGPPSELQRYLDWFDQAATRDYVPYPKPKPLTETELKEQTRRSEIAQKATQSIWNRYERQIRGGDAGANQRWKEACRASNLWVTEVQREANPDLRYRSSRRTCVKKYVREVRQYCHRWNLNSWWAVPAVLQSHMFQATTGIAQLLEVFVSGGWRGKRHTIVVMLPGASESDFQRDRLKFSDVMLKTPMQRPDQPVVVLQRPDRPAMADIEREHNAACVVVDWDGSSRHVSRKDSEASISTADYIIEECENRLGRLLSKVERRDILREVDPQLTEGRKVFLESGWKAASYANIGLHAKWVARRIFHPGETWRETEASTPNAGDDESLDLSSIARACREFVRRANLTLPFPQ